MSDRPGLLRTLGPFDATCVVIGAIIGVGIFFSPGQIARTAGSTDLAMLTWGAAALAALFGAWSFAQLGRDYPKSGGQYEILKDAFGPFSGGLCVLTCISVIIPGSIAVIALICAQNLLPALAGRDASSAETLLYAHGLIWLLAAVNVVGVRWGAGVQNTTVIVKLGVLALVVACALFFSGGGVASDAATASDAAAASASPLHSVQGGWLGALLAGLIPAFFAYGGWQQVLWLGGEVKNARRVLPLAILAGVGVVVVTYLAANWAYFHLLGFEGVARSKALAADALQQVLGSGAARLIAAGVTISAFGVLNVQFMAGPRLAFAAARDGRFFSVFGKVHQRFSTPAHAIVAMAACASLLLACAGADGLDPLTAWVVVPDAIFMILTAMALPLLRRRAHAHLRVPLFCWLFPVLFSLVELGAIGGACLDSSVRNAALLGLTWMSLLALLWWARFRHAPTAT